MVRRHRDRLHRQAARCEGRRDAERPDRRPEVTIGWSELVDSRKRPNRRDDDTLAHDRPRCVAKAGTDLVKSRFTLLLRLKSAVDFSGDFAGVRAGSQFYRQKVPRVVAPFCAHRRRPRGKITKTRSNWSHFRADGGDFGPNFNEWNDLVHVHTS